MRNKRKGYQTKKTPRKGTNGRCSTIVEESNGLTNSLSFLLLKFNVQNFKVKIVG